MFNEIMLSKDETGQGNQLIKQYIYQLDNITDFKPHVFEFKRAISRFFRQPNNHKRCFEYSLQEIYESFEETGTPKIITIQPLIENEQAIVASANTESDNTHENPIINAMLGKDIQVAGYQRHRQNYNNFKSKQRNKNYIPLSSKICECCGNSNKMLVKKLHVLHPPGDPTKCMFRGINYIQDNQIRQRVKQYNLKNPTKPILKNTKALPNSPPDQPILPQVNTGTIQNNDNNEFDEDIYISDEEEQTELMCNGLNNSSDIFNDTIEEINDNLGQLPTPTMNTSHSEFIDSMEQWQDAQEWLLRLHTAIKHETNTDKIVAQLDGGSNSHVFTDRSHFIQYRKRQIQIQQISGTKVNSIGYGMVLIRIGDLIITLWPAYHMPNNPQNTISQPALKFYNKFRSVRTEALDWIKLTDQQGRTTRISTFKKFEHTQN